MILTKEFIDEFWDRLWDCLILKERGGDFQVSIELGVFGVVVCGFLEISTDHTPSTFDTPEWNDADYKVKELHSVEISDENGVQECNIDLFL